MLTNFVFEEDPLDPNGAVDFGSTTPSNDATNEAEDASRGVRQDQTRDMDPSKKLKREPLMQYWAFRFTYEKVDPKKLRDWLDTKTVAYGYQVEKGGKTGQKHFQGAFDVGRDNRLRETPLREQLEQEFPDLMFPARDYCSRSKSKAADRYAMKEDTRVEGPWYKGVVFDTLAKELVYNIDIILRPWQIRIKAILDGPPDDRHIWWFWEPYGGLGKTTFQKWIYQEYEDVLVLGGKAADMKNAIIELLDKQTKASMPKKLPKILIMNIPKTFNVDYFSPSGTEEVKDMFFASGKYHGGMVSGRPPTVLIFANCEPPNVHDMAKDRWRIVRLPDGPGDREELHRETWLD